MEIWSNRWYAEFERSTLTEVIEARAKATSTTIDINAANSAQLAQFQQAQGELNSALSRLLVSVERYPELKANQNFLELQSQLEGTENRINVERNRFNNLAGDYNISIQKIPMKFIASWGNFEALALFSADQGAEDAPEVGLTKMEAQTLFSAQDEQEIVTAIQEAERQLRERRVHVEAAVALKKRLSAIEGFKCFK